MATSEWMSVAEAAAVLEVSRRTALRSVSDEERRAAEWGAEGEGWRLKPLSGRKSYQLRRATVFAKAGKADDTETSSAN